MGLNAWNCDYYPGKEETKMRIDVVKTKVFGFKELSDEARQAAFEALGDINVDYEWWDTVYDDAKTIGKLMGIDIDNIYFSGFSSKGDGACFEGCYEYVKGSRAAVKAHAPKDEELLRIATELAAVQRRCFYQVRAGVKHSGHYYHRFCTDIAVDFESHISGHDYYSPHDEAAVAELLRDFMHWIYRQLETEHDYLIGDAAIVETIEANDFEFAVDGELYN